MAGEIARLFATLGFTVNEAGLKKFQSKLEQTKKQIDSSDGLTGSTKKARQQFSDMFKEIRGNYSKVRPNAVQMRKDLERIDEALKQNKISSEEYAEARMRITEQLGKVQRQQESAHERALKERDQEESRQAKAREKEQKQAAAEFNRRQKQREQFYKAQQTAKDKLNNKLKQIEKRYDKEAYQLKEIRNNVKLVNDAYRRGEVTLDHRRRQVQRLTAEYRRLQAAQREAAARPFAGGADPRQVGNHRLISAIHSDVGLGIISGGFAAAQSTMAFQNFQAMQQGLTMASGSMEQAGEDMEYLISLSRRLGVFVGDLGSSFASFSAAARGTNLTSQETRDIFGAVASQARVLNLSAADTQGIMRATTQILNKQQVMAIISLVM